MPELLTIQQAADLIGVKRQAVTNRIKSGKLKAQLIDGHYYIDPQDVTPGKLRSGRKVNMKPDDTKDAQFALENATCTLTEYRSDHPNATASDYCRAVLNMLGWRKTSSLVAEMVKQLQA